GDRAEAWPDGEIEVVFQQLTKLTGHLEPQGVHPYVRDFAAAEYWLHLCLEKVPLSEQSLNWMLRLLKGSDEVVSQYRADLHVALLGLCDELVQSLMFAAGVEVEVELPAF